MALTSTSQKPFFQLTPGTAVPSSLAPLVRQINQGFQNQANFLNSLEVASITLSTTGFIEGGQTAYNTGTGFWLGYNSGTASYNLSIGNPASNFFTFDGTNISMVAGALGNNSVIINSNGFQVGATSSRNTVLGTVGGNPCMLGFQSSGTSNRLLVGLDGSNTPFIQFSNSFGSITISCANPGTGGQAISLITGATSTLQIGTATYTSAGFSVQTGSATSITTTGLIVGSAGSNNAVMQMNAPTATTPLATIFHKARGGGDNDIGFLFRNDFWTNNASAGMCSIVAHDNASSGGELWFRTTRSGGGSGGTPTDSLYILQDATLKIFNNSGTPGTPSGGGHLYVNAGALWYKGSSGTNTLIANA